MTDQLNRPILPRRKTRCHLSHDLDTQSFPCQADILNTAPLVGLRLTHVICDWKKKTLQIHASHIIRLMPSCTHEQRLWLPLRLQLARHDMIQKYVFGCGVLENEMDAKSVRLLPFFGDGAMAQWQRARP